MTNESIDFTADELRMLIWVCQNDYFYRCRNSNLSGKKIENSREMDMIVSIIKKAQLELAIKTQEA